MKTLLLGLAVILVLGIGGFIYRNVTEHSGPAATACTLEAKICPDGTSVGRTGPNCEFAACAAPNVEFADKNFSFALPAGYQKGVQQPGADGEVEGMLDFYEKATASSTNTITVYDFPIPAGKTANDVILANTELSPSGMKPESMDKFSPVFVNGKNYEEITIERFEGVVASAYYLARANDVLRFDIIERDVSNWTDANLVIDQLPGHTDLLRMLGTLQTP